MKKTLGHLAATFVGLIFLFPGIVVVAPVVMLCWIAQGVLAVAPWIIFHLIEPWWGPYTRAAIKIRDWLKGDLK